MAYTNSDDRFLQLLHIQPFTPEPVNRADEYIEMDAQEFAAKAIYTMKRLKAERNKYKSLFCSAAIVAAMLGLGLAVMAAANIWGWK